MSKGYRFGNHNAGVRLAEALARAIEEHGCPNSFAPSELALHYLVEIYATTQGKYRRARATDYGRLWTDITFVMREAGYGLVYSDRRFEITSAPGFVADGGPSD